MKILINNRMKETCVMDDASNEKLKKLINNNRKFVKECKEYVETKNTCNILVGDHEELQGHALALEQDLDKY